MTSEALYEPIVFLKQPYWMHGSISFGYKNHTLIYDNPTEIKFQAFADVLNSAKIKYQSLSNLKHCPRDVLKFSPPPQRVQCDQSTYQDLTELRQYGINISFHNVSLHQQIYEIIHIADPFYCSL